MPVINRIADFQAEMTGWRHDLHAHPETAFEENRTADAVAPLRAGQVSASLIGFLVIYAIVFSAGALYILRLIAQGPDEDGPPASVRPRAPGSPLAAIEERPCAPL